MVTKVTTGKETCTSGHVYRYIESATQTLTLCWHLDWLRASCPLHGTVCRFWQLKRPGCALKEVNVSIQSKEELQDTPFTCRVGEIMVRHNLASSVYKCNTTKPKHLTSLPLCTSCWMCPVCRIPLSRFRACVFMMWCGCMVLVPQPSPALPRCASTPLCAGNTRPSSYATSGCTGDGWEDPIHESPQVSWCWWDGHILICLEWRSWQCRRPLACWSWWWSQ